MAFEVDRRKPYRDTVLRKYLEAGTLKVTATSRGLEAAHTPYATATTG